MLLSSFSSVSFYKKVRFLVASLFFFPSYPLINLLAMGIAYAPAVSEHKAAKIRTSMAEDTYGNNKSNDLGSPKEWGK